MSGRGDDAQPFAPNTHDSVLAQALTWLDRGHRVALATVVDTWGSSPRPRGSMLAIREDGLFTGSVSGGCVEGKVVTAAEEILRRAAADREARPHALLEIGVSNEEAWDVGLACGGTVRIFVSPVDREVLLRATRAAAENKAIVLLTPLDGRPARTWQSGDAELPFELRDAKGRALASDAASSVETSEGVMFVQAQQPKLRLFIVGAVHIADALIPIASRLDYEVTVIDPRPAFARKERWPHVDVVCEWPDVVLENGARLDPRSAVVALTHDPKIDDPALSAALASDAFYIGALGSKKSHAARLLRLREEGKSEADVARIFGPVGLAIGAKSPSEIAVSIVAQMVATLRAPSTRDRTDRADPAKRE